MAYPPAPATPPPAPGVRPAGRNTAAVVALVLGIVALLTFWSVIGGILLGLGAILAGIIGWRRARRGPGSGSAMAVVGAVLGAVALLVSVVIVAIGVSVLNSDKFHNLQDCLNHAKNDTDRNNCAKDFTH